MAFRSTYPVVRDSQGKQTNAADATVHADTGALPAGIYDVRIAVGGSVAAIWIIQVRNAANSDNTGDTHTVYSAAGQTAQFTLGNVDLNLNERIRVVNDGAITGTTAGNVFAYRSN